MSPKIKFQSGQTLIETMVASMVLVMGISAAVGLASYGLTATTSVTRQLTAIGLAREGVEAVKNMRDTNWLKTPLSDTCFNYYDSTNSAKCYVSWLDGLASGGYNINPGSSQTYYLSYNSLVAENAYWQLIPTSSLYGLNLTTQVPDTGYYSVGASGVLPSNATSNFARKITISTDSSFAPFNNASLGPRVKVRVDVWWKDRRCPVSDDVPANPGCKLSLETYLTNWKNY